MPFFWIVVLGTLAGAISGLVGIGGGIIIVPGLIYLLGMAQQTAQGTTLAMLLLPIGALAVWTYAKAGFIDWKVAAFLGLGYIGGSWLGARLAVTMNGSDLKRVFAGFLILCAIKLFWDSYR